MFDCSVSIARTRASGCAALRAPACSPGRNSSRRPSASTVSDLRILSSSSEIEILIGGDVEQRAFARALPDGRERVRIFPLAVEARPSHAQRQDIVGGLAPAPGFDERELHDAVRLAERDRRLQARRDMRRCPCRRTSGCAPGRPAARRARKWCACAAGAAAAFAARQHQRLEFRHQRRQDRARLGGSRTAGTRGSHRARA